MHYILGLLQETEFAIYDLRFDCRYVVKLQLVANDGQVGELSHVTFSSPSCQHVTVIGDVQPDCPTNGKYCRVCQLSAWIVNIFVQTCGQRSPKEDHVAGRDHLF